MRWRWIAPSGKCGDASSTTCSFARSFDTHGPRFWNSLSYAMKDEATRTKMHMNKIKSGWNGVRRVAYRRRFDDFFPPVTFGPSVAFDVNGFIIVPPRSLYSSSLFPQTPRHHRPMRFQIHRVLLPFPDDTLYACMYMYVCICIRLADVLLLLPPCPKKPSLSPFSAGNPRLVLACLLSSARLGLRV